MKKDIESTNNDILQLQFKVYVNMDIYGVKYLTKLIMNHPNTIFDDVNIDVFNLILLIY